MNIKKFAIMVVYWALYLTLTMAIFERIGIKPGVIPGGLIGWAVIVELPRVIVGMLIGMVFYQETKSKVNKGKK